MFKWNSDFSWKLKFCEHISCLSWHYKNFPLKVCCAEWTDLLPREVSASTTISKVKKLLHQKNQINPMSNHLPALRGAGNKWGCTTWLMLCHMVGTLVWGSHDPGSIFVGIITSKDRSGSYVQNESSGPAPPVSNTEWKAPHWLRSREKK